MDIIQFILNNETICTEEPPASTLLDFIRYRKHLCGTKIGCREGDCGACTVLVGEESGGETKYRSMTSCLTPLANVQGKHVVSVEGINRPGQELTPVQAALVEENGTQCGFCTVGFVMSLTGFCLENKQARQADAIEAVDGNICRCTGYKSIERAALRLTNLLQSRPAPCPALDFAVQNQVVPSYFLGMNQRLIDLSQGTEPEALPLAVGANAKETAAKETPPLPSLYMAGGTDLFVQKPDDLPGTNARHLFDKKTLRGIRLNEGYFEIGSAVTVTDMKNSAELNRAFPNLQAYLSLVSSTPIRNMATLGGNLVNASPIGDLTVFLLALDAMITLSDGDSCRELPLRCFYKGYKSLDKTPAEILTHIRFRSPAAQQRFNFEKVSKRTYLDIASVNSAMLLTLTGEVISDCHVSIGGVAPIPLFLEGTSRFLAGKSMGNYQDWFSEADEVLQSEISPISDVRGSAAYKRLLARQLLLAHFSEAV